MSDALLAQRAERQRGPSKKVLRTGLLALLLFATLTSMAAAQAPLAIVVFSVDSGGGVSSGTGSRGEYRLTGVIGQPDAATSTGGNFVVMGGLLEPEPWRVWLPSVER